MPRPADRPMPRCRPAPEYPPPPDYLPATGYRPMPAERPAECWLADGLAVLDHPPVPDRPAGPPVGRRAAVLGYLTVPVPGVPMLICLGTLRRHRWARRHAAQAVNVWFTGLLYDLSAVIMGAMLALGSPRAALMVFAPLVAARWLVTLAYLARAARAAGRGMGYAFPAWLCMRVVR